MEVASSEEAECLHALSVVPEAEVSYTDHVTINQRRSEIFCRDFLRYSEDELLKEMKSEGAVCTLIPEESRRDIDTDAVPSSDPQQTDLGEEVRCAWHWLPVKVYISNPCHYFHCQSLGSVARPVGVSKMVPLPCITCD